MSDTNQNSQGPYGQNGAGEGNRGPIIPKSPTEALRPEKVPAPPKRSRKAHGQLVIFLNFLMTLAVAVCVNKADDKILVRIGFEREIC